MRPGGVAQLDVARAAPTAAVWAFLGAELRALPGSVRIVLLGAGLLEALSGATPPSSRDERVLAQWQEPARRLSRADTLTVALGRGRLAGVAVELALACDLRLLAADASMALDMVPAGRVPGLGAAARLAALAGPARATELLLTGRTVGAAEAVALGLATLAVPVGELAAAADDLCAALLVPPRDAVIEALGLVRGARHADPLAASREALARLSASGEEPGGRIAPVGSDEAP